MTCRADPAARLLPLAAAALLALAAPGRAGSPSGTADPLAAARGDLARSDGIAAEVRLKKVLAADSRREAVAALMGEALLDQGKRDAAREWLAPGKFAPADASRGFRTLGRLEKLEGNLPAAGHAYDRALKIKSADPLLWVDIGRLRYQGGEHTLAIQAADYALALDPKNVPALQFRGQLVRDQFGLTASLAWFEAALTEAPDNLDVLGDYAATLGELGRGSDMLQVTRKMLTIDERNPRALFLQAMLAARGGEFNTARSLLNKTGDRLGAVPAAMLLNGVIELRSGNYLLAIEALERLVRLQPANAQAQQLLAGAYYGAGNYKLVTERFAALAARSDASAYLLTTLARAHEMLGQRDRAAALLDRAANPVDRPFAPVPENEPLGALVNAHSFAAAEAIAEKMRRDAPGSAIAQALAGDVQFAMDRNAAALERYRQAGSVWLSGSLLTRLTVALAKSGHGGDAMLLSEAYLAQNPLSRPALRIAAAYAGIAKEWDRAAVLLDAMRRNGGGGDVRLLADLALAQLESGNAKAAEESAREAYELQPANPAAAQAWGMSLAALGERASDARALLDQARAIGGDNPMLVAARRKIGG